MMPYIWDYRDRVLFALACLVISKLAMVGVPVVLKYIVDGLDADPGQTLVLPIMLLLVYGVLRFINAGFNELRDAIEALKQHGSIRYSSSRYIIDLAAYLYSSTWRIHLYI